MEVCLAGLYISFFIILCILISIGFLVTGLRSKNRRLLGYSAITGSFPLILFAAVFGILMLHDSPATVTLLFLLCSISAGCLLYAGYKSLRKDTERAAEDLLQTIGQEKF